MRTVKERIYEAWAELGRREGKRPSGTEIARRASLAAGKEIKQGVVSRWLSGDASPTLENGDYLAKALNVEPVWLFYGRGHPRPWELEPVKDSPTPERVD